MLYIQRWRFRDSLETSDWYNSPIVTEQVQLLLLMLEHSCTVLGKTCRHVSLDLGVGRLDRPLEVTKPPEMECRWNRMKTIICDYFIKHLYNQIIIINILL